MFKPTELLSIILAIIILTFVISFNKLANTELSQAIILMSLVSITIIIFANVLVKKLTANYYESETEQKIWMWKRYGLKRGYYLKKPLPAGIILPFLISLLSYGYFIWLSVLEFEIHVHPSRASKRHQMYKFSEMTEIHLGIIAASSIIINLLLAILGYLTNFIEFAKLNIYYAVFSLIPLGNLDGAKIFFAKKELWITLVIICGIFLLYSFLLI